MIISEATGRHLKRLQRKQRVFKERWYAKNANETHYVSISSLSTDYKIPLYLTTLVEIYLQY